MKLEGKSALVTGASRGIGRAVAAALAAEGAAVAVNYRSGKAQADEVVKEIESNGGKAVTVEGDVSEYEAAQRIVEQSIEQLGGLHVLVNNAGISRDALIFNMEPTDWLDVMRVNFGGVFNCTKAVLQHFMSQREGTIVNVSSMMGLRGWTGESNYAASKGAINAFTRCAAVELARFGLRADRPRPGAAREGRRQGDPQADPDEDLRNGRGGRRRRDLPSGARFELHDRRARRGRRRRGHYARHRRPIMIGATKRPAR